MINDVLKNIWPEWQVEGEPLGRGAYGVVYKAVRREHDVESYAAIKVITIRSDSPEVDSLRSDGLDETATKTYLNALVKDFVSEIKMMESLKGVQNIVSVEDFKVVEKDGLEGWDIYIRMELLTPFNSYFCDKQISEDDVIKLGCDICSALEICAKRNIIHRDIKPDNIFVNDFGYFKLGDFGIARKMENMTGGLSQKGTFNYMAPEVANSRDYDERVDIYSLGIVLYKLLNGNRLPFMDTEKQLLNPNERKNAIERRIRGEKLPAPRDASDAMSAVILKACAFDPDQRFASATEMKNALLSVHTMKTQEFDDKTVSVNTPPKSQTVAPEVASNNTFEDRTVAVDNIPVSAPTPTPVQEDKTVRVDSAPAPNTASIPSDDKTVCVKKANPDFTYGTQPMNILDELESAGSEEDKYLFATFGGPSKKKAKDEAKTSEKSETSEPEIQPFSFESDSNESFKIELDPNTSYKGSYKSGLDSNQIRKIAVFASPAVSLLLYIGFYMILIPALYKTTLNFFDWLFMDISNIITVISDVNNILVPAYVVVLLGILQYVLLAAFVVSCFFFAKELHNPKKSLNFYVKYVGNEPQLMLAEIYDTVRNNSASDRLTKDSLRMVIDSLKYSKEFGLHSEDKIVFVENEICDIIDALKNVAASDDPEDLKKLSDNVKILKQKNSLRNNMIKR